MAFGLQHGTKFFFTSQTVPVAWFKISLTE